MMTTPQFNPASVQVFRFIDCSLDANTGTVQLHYGFDDAPVMVETIQIPGAPFVLDAQRAAAVQRALHLLHWLAGVSYYKAAVPKQMRFENAALDADSARLLQSVYRYGLGEFSYRNGLQLEGRIDFSSCVASDALTPAPALGLREHALVAIGGGKDSLVTIESLRDAGVAQTVCWVGGSQLIASCAARTGLPMHNIQRQIAPQLFEYNQQGAYNGHIPVTAINSAILVLAALLHGANQVVFSNEHSASYGSQIAGTGEVNHQWSKGWEFEQAFGVYVSQFIAQDFHYYSLLRPFSELAVARQFARSDHYDAYFSSCNRNFHILGERPVNRWCGVCPKCHFVFLALAPFMPKLRLVNLFGRNLLDDASQIPGFNALLEFGEHKPFECVGEARESRAALAALAGKAEWQVDDVVQHFVKTIQPQLPAESLDMTALLQVQGAHRIPAAIWEHVSARFAA